MLKLVKRDGEVYYLWLCDHCKCPICWDHLVLLGIQAHSSWHRFVTFSVHKVCEVPFKEGHDGQEFIRLVGLAIQDGSEEKFAAPADDNHPDPGHLHASGGDRLGL